MQIGLALPQFDFSIWSEQPLRWETVLEWARRAEAMGFDSVWFADHLFLEITKYGGPSGIHGAYDPLVALGAVARATSTIRLGTLALCGPLRHATVLAKALSSLDVISNGRLTVTLGAGWYEAELALVGAAGERPRERLARLNEQVQVLKGMFATSPFSFEGSYERVAEAWCLPQPVQRPGPPLWIGGEGDRLLALIARHADGWNACWRWTPERYSQRLRVLVEACERTGRDPATVTRSLGLYALVGEDEADLARRFERMRKSSAPGVLDHISLDQWRSERLVGTVDQVRDQLSAWEELGIEHLIVSAGPLPFSISSPEDVDLIAQACNLSRDGTRSA